MTLFQFHVAGIASTQGNKSAFVTKTGKAVMREGRSKQAKANFDAWRHAVATEARRAAVPCTELEAGPVLVTLAFRMIRPAAEPKRRRTWPIKARSGDLDKLARACLDAITGVLIVDDAQVVGLAVTKDWGAPGVHVTVDALEDDPTVDYWPTWQPVLHLEEHARLEEALDRLDAQ